MPPLIPRRRSRRRSLSGRLVLLICALIVTALLVGGITQVSRQSGPYDVSMNRSFAALGAVVADESTTTGSAVRHLMVTMRTQNRPGLQADLDRLVQQSDNQTRAASIGTPVPADGLAMEFAAVFSERASAVRALRSSIDELLGMQPLPIAGSPAGERTEASAPTLLSSTAATNRIAAAGALLVRADASYQAVRHSLAREVGHARLPSSKWVPRAQLWQVGSVATAVDLVTTSPTLVATHRLVLRTVRLSPQVLPPPTGVTTANVSVLSPTTTVVVSVVLSDLGSVDEPHASVQFSMTPLLTGVAVTKTRDTAVGIGQSVTMSAVTFEVKPGHSYQLTVSIVLPPAQTDSTETSVTDDLQIAPTT
jgi:hypothetical protein